MTFKATSGHLIIWLEHSKPNWAKNIEIPARASIHDLINNRAGIKFDNSLSNALSLLDMVRRRLSREKNGEKLVDYMENYIDSGAPSTHRGKHYQRWARRMKKVKFSF